MIAVALLLACTGAPDPVEQPPEPAIVSKIRLLYPC